GNTSGASGVVSNGGGVAKKKYSIAAYKGKVLFGHPKYDQTEAKDQDGSSVKYYIKYTGKSGSIVDALKEIGADSSAASRIRIAAANNITGYKGTAEQNTRMLSLLKKGKLIQG
ncbi:MAG: hypothetical protein NC489_30000, partial [Ruminococcus flavefaciens]|nr:hypothetical protein [Ruminococcus flavefaciens]